MADNNPKLVTSSWFTKLPGTGTSGATDTHIKIGISRGVPRGIGAGFRLFKVLQPGTWFNSVSPDEYRRRYFEEVLAPLDPQEIVHLITGFAGDRTGVLVCFEAPHKPDDWCHRGYVSAWLDDTLGLKVPELGMEAQGWGWSHPKLPTTQRVRPAQQSVRGLFDAA